MERQDVRMGTWVFIDHNYNLLFEGEFSEVSKFSTNANGLLMSKQYYEQFKSEM
jgi:hypothetical protein